MQKNKPSVYDHSKGGGKCPMTIITEKTAERNEDQPN